MATWKTAAYGTSNLRRKDIRENKEESRRNA
jgi:hypothetical protein